MCRPGQIASFPVNSSISQDGLVVAFDFYPYTGGPAAQTIFSIRDATTNVISLRADYFLSSGTLNIWRNSSKTSPTYLFETSTAKAIPITIGSWNRILIEIVQAQPSSFGAGFSSIRVWVNETSPQRVYFGNFTTDDITIMDGNNAALEICGVYDSTSPNNVNPSLTGYFDILNFMWFQGAQSLYQSEVVPPTCLWKGTFQITTDNCLVCGSGHYLEDDFNCVSSALNSSYYFHSPTNSYQMCFYGSEVECYNHGFGCLYPCWTCSGPAANNCLSCSDNLYLDSSTCVSQCPQGEFPNNQTQTCDMCPTVCQNCSGPSNGECINCKSGYYILTNSTGSFCLQNCPSVSYYSNATDFKCFECSQSCLACDGPMPNNCASCDETSFFSTNSTGSYCGGVCPRGYTPDYGSNVCVTSLVNISKAQSGTLIGAPAVTVAALAVSNIVSGSFSISMMMCLLATESLANMQYLNINHSKIASTIYSEISSSYVPNWIVLLNHLEEDALIFNWGIFKHNQVSSLYLDNYGDTLTEIMIYVGAFIVTLFFRLFSNLDSLANSFVGKAYITAFSFLVSNILGNLQGQILFSILQIIRMDLFIDKYSRLSLITAYITTSVVFGLLIFCFLRR